MSCKMMSFFVLAFFSLLFEHVRVWDSTNLDEDDAFSSDILVPCELTLFWQV